MLHLHQKIRNDIEGRIMSGEWPPGHRLPFEHELMVQYDCSRMTVSKVLSAMATQGLITRRRRAGSVVAAPKADRAFLEIRDFALEAARSGKTYRHKVLRRAVEPIDAKTAARIGMEAGTRMLFIETLHSLEGAPEAYEDRIVNLAAIPNAEGEKFTDIPVGTWLLQQVPWSDAEHVIRAVNADAKLHKLLKVATGAACLVLERRTWQSDVFLTEARLYYPGEHHRMVGRFSPAGNNSFKPPVAQKSRRKAEA